MNNKSSDTDHLSIILAEKNDKTITYSKTLFYQLTKHSPSDYTIGEAQTKKDDIIVPYSIIKAAKLAKDENVKEIILLASERPDKITKVRSTLDLWGLSSYVDYIYTNAELAFLEGLTPTFEGGFLGPTEIKKISEILAFIKVLIPSSNLKYYEKKHGKEFAQKYLDIRFKMIEWSGKLGIPIISGVIIGQDQNESQTKSTIDKIFKLHEKYNHIHSISIQSESLLTTGKATKKSDTLMLKAIQYIQSFESNITISTPPMHTDNIELFIDEGIRDFGSIPINSSSVFPKSDPFSLDDIEKIVEQKGFTFHQRLPIKYDYIKDGFYSKKLGQVYDSYKYKIKKYEQEKLKDLKATL